MQQLIQSKLEGLSEPMKQFGKKLKECKTDGGDAGQFNGLILDEMRSLDFDSSETDRFDNIVGTMNGYRQEQDIALVFHLDYAQGRKPGETAPYGNSIGSYDQGIISALYSAAVLKRTLLPLVGDVLVCGVPRSGCCGFGIKYLFDYYLRKRVNRLKGIILCEPTDMNVYLGHKGRMEYEIVVKVRLGNGFVESRGINILGTMFPLIHELENLSRNLPLNNSMGGSSLKIKDVHFCGTQPLDKENEFKVIVDRTFVPEEQQENILERAKMIAQSVYRGEQSVLVETAVARENIKTIAGTNVVSEKEIKPWSMEPSHPFVLRSLQALTDNGFTPGTGYWKNTMTEGSYTFGELGIPTFGFGPSMESATEASGFETVKKAVYGQAMMLHRNIGVPTFGWSSDEI